MDAPVHELHDLFCQLGLPDDPSSIESFIARHRPLPETLRLTDAPFWTPGQKQFLQEEILQDADWAEIIDALDSLLRR